MKLIYFILVSAFFASVSLTVEAAIPGTAAQPSTYNITITKAELCRSSACSNPFLLGSGNKSFDISAASAGADVGNFVDISQIPLFQTWTHVRVTISSTISVGATWTDGDGDACGTSNATQASGHAAVYAASAGGTAAAANFVIPNVGFSTIAQADYDGFNLSKTNGASTATVTYPLTAPYVCKGVMPHIAVEFNTASAFGYIPGTAAGAGTACQAFPRPPDVSITVFDP